MTLFQYFWRFAQICKKFAAFAHKIVFVIDSVVKLFRNNTENNFALIRCKFLANLCKSSEIVEQCHVKWWLGYRYNRSVSWRLSCNLKEFRDPRTLHLFLISYSLFPSRRTAMRCAHYLTATKRRRRPSPIYNGAKSFIWFFLYRLFFLRLIA